MLRDFASPNPAYTVQCISDTHFGMVSSAVLGWIAADMARLPTPLALLGAGDIAQTPTTVERDAALAWLNGLGLTYYLCPGNHDVDGYTAAEFSTWYSTPAVNYVVDLGPFVLISLSVTANTEEGRSLDAETLTYLDTQLGATSKPCIVMHHIPLDGTAYSADAGRWLAVDSTFAGVTWHVPNTADVKTILAAHSNARVWLSGHLHSPYWMPQKIVDIKDVGHSLVHINLESPYYQDYTHGYNNRAPVTSFYLTVYDGFTEVRVRDHHYRKWRGYWRFPNWQTEV